MDLIHGLGEKSFSRENKLFISSADLAEFDYLLFVDSRGCVNNEDIFEYSYVALLKELFGDLDKRYLIISRPKNLTTFPTLYNFIKLNPNLKFKQLITNLGFVDCTPKKTENILDMELQISQFSESKNNIIEFENTKLSCGNFEKLKSIEYSENYKNELLSFFSSQFNEIYFINTPLISEDIEIERKRPKSFFTQIKVTNDLLDEFSRYNQNQLINIKSFHCTYDGVHYTKEEHKIIFEKIKEKLSL